MAEKDKEIELAEKDNFSRYVLYIVLAVVVFAVITLIFGLNKPEMMRVGEASQPACTYSLDPGIENGGIYFDVQEGPPGVCPPRCNNYDPFLITPTFYLKGTGNPYCEYCGVKSDGASKVVRYAYGNPCIEYKSSHADLNDDALLTRAGDKCIELCTGQSPGFTIKKAGGASSYGAPAICEHAPCDWTGACGKYSFKKLFESHFGCADCDDDYNDPQPGVIYPYTVYENYECRGPTISCRCIPEVSYIPGDGGTVAIADAGGDTGGTTTTTSGETPTTTGTSTKKGKSLD